MSQYTTADFDSAKKELDTAISSGNSVAINNAFTNLNKIGTDLIGKTGSQPGSSMGDSRTDGDLQSVINSYKIKDSVVRAMNPGHSSGDDSRDPQPIALQSVNININPADAKNLQEAKNIQASIQANIDRAEQNISALTRAGVVASDPRWKQAQNDLTNLNSDKTRADARVSQMAITDGQANVALQSVNININPADAKNLQEAKNIQASIQANIDRAEQNISALTRAGVVASDPRWKQAQNDLTNLNSDKTRADARVIELGIGGSGPKGAPGAEYAALQQKINSAAAETYQDDFAANKPNSYAAAIKMQDDIQSNLDIAKAKLKELESLGVGPTDSRYENIANDIAKLKGDKQTLAGRLQNDPDLKKEPVVTGGNPVGDGTPAVGVGSGGGGKPGGGKDLFTGGGRQPVYAPATAGGTMTVIDHRFDNVVKLVDVSASQAQATKDGSRLAAAQAGIDSKILNKGDSLNAWGAAADKAGLNEEQKKAFIKQQAGLQKWTEADWKGLTAYAALHSKDILSPGGGTTTSPDGTATTATSAGGPGVNTGAGPTISTLPGAPAVTPTTKPAFDKPPTKPTGIAYNGTTIAPNSNLAGGATGTIAVPVKANDANGSVGVATVARTAAANNTIADATSGNVLYQGSKLNEATISSGTPAEQAAYKEAHQASVSGAPMTEAQKSIIVNHMAQANGGTALTKAQWAELAKLETANNAAAGIPMTDRAKEAIKAQVAATKKDPEAPKTVAQYVAEAPKVSGGGGGGGAESALVVSPPKPKDDGGGGGGGKKKKRD